MRNIIILLALSFILAVPMSAAGAQENIPEPDEIDIYDTSSGEFLTADTGVYAQLGRKAYQEVDYELAAQYYLTYLKHDPANNTVIYNLACCYGLLGEAELASHYLTIAHAKGFENLELMETDTDFNLVRDTDEFKDSLGKIKEQLKHLLVDTTVIYLPCEAYTPCHVRFPDDYIPGEPRTVVVALAANTGFAYGFSLIYDSFEDPDFIFAAIQGPYPGIYGKYLMYCWDFQPPGEELPSDVYGMSTGNVATAIRELKDELNADRIFLLGFNEGAAFAYRAGLANPELVDGIISFEGQLDTGFILDATLTAGKDIPIFIVHNLARSEDAGTVLESYGYDVMLYTYEGEPCEEKYVYGEIQKWMDSCN